MKTIMKAFEKNDSLNCFLKDYSIDDWIDIWKVLKDYTDDLLEILEIDYYDDSENPLMANFDELAEAITEDLKDVKDFEGNQFYLSGDDLFDIINGKHGFNELYCLLILGF